jgi:two-component system LytT family response regulator
MKSIKCIVVDDEPLAIEGMCILIKKVPFLELVKTFLNPEEAAAFLREQAMDLVFCDIRMPQYSGIDWFKTLETKPLIIFTTAHTEYAVEGFELNAIDYLLKPISFERFYKAVTRTQEYLELKQQQDQPEADNHIFIRCSGKFEKIVLNDILYIEGLKDYVKIVVENSKQSLITAMNVKTISEKLPAQQFIRTHRSYLVNVNKIKSVDKDTVMLPDVSIPIGETYKADVFKLVLEGKLLKRK